MGSAEVCSPVWLLSVRPGFWNPGRAIIRGLGAPLVTKDRHRVLRDSKNLQLLLPGARRPLVPRVRLHLLQSGAMLEWWWQLPPMHRFTQFPSTLSVQNGTGAEACPVQLLVDSRPPKFLSAMITIHKGYRYYRGKTWAPSRSTPPAWKDGDLARRLRIWLAYHYRLGIEHVYIVDNEPSRKWLNGLGLPGWPDNVTLIRTHVPYDAPPNSTIARRESKLSALFIRVPGQLVIENSIASMAATSWLLSTDVDEFLVPIRNPGLRQSLAAQPRDVGSVGYAPVIVRTSRAASLVPSGAGTPCFSADGSRSWTSDSRAQTLRLGPVFQRKVVFRPEAVDTLSVHYVRFRRSAELRYTEVQSSPSKGGFLAHFQLPEVAAVSSERKQRGRSPEGDQLARMLSESSSATCE